ncbi:DNA-3-methyladenine glycosylase 2 family protein [bacterium CPR1]|nr:DNA-3-methyladenine glycosylase 2 family protein [bacterium CPR1]
MTLDDETCYRALSARDPRFDGQFFVAVCSTRIYCRPICPARRPARRSCAFYANAAQAERAGYRACLRCRPELAPGQAPVDAVSRLVQSAVKLIDEGFLNEASLEELAGRLGVSARHLRRSMQSELGVSPVGLAQTRRLAMARQLLRDSELSLTEVAFACGFGSLRRFNALFQEQFGRPPSSLRCEGPPASGLSLRLDYRPPYDWAGMLAFLRARAVTGLESVSDHEVRRLTPQGEILVGHHPARPALVARLPLSLARQTLSLRARLRSLFDLDAHPAEIAQVLGPGYDAGLRVPGAFDPFEMALRAVLGQQVSVRAATTLAGRLVARYGGFFPGPQMLAEEDPEEIASLGLPRARARSLVSLAGKVASGELRLDGSQPLQETLSKLESLPGIGPWTSHYVALRALHWPDAFPQTDLGVRKLLGPKALELAERWRPWRSYAVMHLWTKGNLP